MESCTDLIPHRDTAEVDIPEEKNNLCDVETGLLVSWCVAVDVTEIKILLV